jgi:uncharacterized repeat protein (TIGR03803 family)
MGGTKKPKKRKQMKTLLVTISIAAMSYCSAQVSLVGTSSHGGFGNHGTLFSVSSVGALDTLYNFNAGNNGCSPFGSMVTANDGNLYGFTASCGSNSVGTLIRYNPNTKVVSTVIDFSTTIGDGPMGNLILGSDGDLYGMTNSGGTAGYGTIFKCTTTGVLTTLVNFNNTNGGSPCGTLVEGNDGNFYGMTRFGGTHNLGIVFKCSPLGVLTILHSFAGGDGEEPLGSVTIVKDSIIYGMTYAGGAYSGGVIFNCTTSGNYHMLTSLNSTTGMFPMGTLINGKDGYLYGLAYYGGMWYVGTLFRCNDSGSVTVLANFTDTNGAYPMGSPTLGTDGNIYGTTSTGGNLTAKAGAIFKYDRVSNQLTDILQFCGSGPVQPQGDLMEMNTNVTGINEVATVTNVNLYPNPNKGEFTLEVNNTETASADTKDNVKLEVYNTVGQMVHTQNIQNDVKQSTINLGSEPSGVYIYKVVSDNSGMLANGRFVIE